jgi:hypothetical protein
MAYPKREESAEDTLRKHQGLNGNELVQSIAFQMLNLKSQLEEINADRGGMGQSAFKAENEIFKPFRKAVRDLLNLTEAEIKDKELMEKLKKYLNLPYGSYPSYVLTDLGQRLYVHLRKLRIIWISWEFDEETVAAKWQKP